MDSKTTTQRTFMRQSGGYSSTREFLPPANKLYDPSFSNKYAEKILDETQDERFLDSIYDFNRSKSIVRTKVYVPPKNDEDILRET